MALCGPLAGPAAEAEALGEERLTRSWWEQAETLTALVSLWRHTGEESYRKALDCYNSPEYQAAAKLRQQYSDSDIVIVEGT